MTLDDAKAICAQALISVDAGLICLADLASQYHIPDGELKSVAGFFEDAGRDLRAIRDHQDP
jgi:hypothetical protein